MSVIITIKVVPSSGKNKWVLDKAGTLKCYLKSPPEKGLANRELIKILSKTFKIPGADVEIMTGQTSRLKRVKLNLAISFEDVLNILGLEKPENQLPLFE
jgi:uncharacterized protein (TIGR00251 family)